MDQPPGDRPQRHTTDLRRLLDNIVSLYLLQGLNYLIPLAVLPYLVRVLGMEAYGLVAVAQSFAQYFNILTDYGFNFSATRSIAQSKHEPEHSSPYRLLCVSGQDLPDCRGSGGAWMRAAHSPTHEA